MAIGTPVAGTAIDGSAAGTAATSAVVDCTAATNGEVMFLLGVVGDAQTGAISTPSGWNLLGQTSEGTTGGSSSRACVFWKVKSGDTSVTVNWSVSAKKQWAVVSWPGVDTTTPAESLTWATHTTGNTYATGSGTPTAANRWAAGLFTSRGSTAVVAWTPDAAQTERLDVINTITPFIGLEVADTNAAVTQAAHSYTATGQTASHGLAAVFYLIPAVGSLTPTVTDSVGLTDTRVVAGPRSFPAHISDPVSGEPVEAEAHTNLPAYLMPNGSMYRAMESSLADGNHPLMMRSTDGGNSWAQVGTNPSSVADLECVTASVTGTVINHTICPDTNVYWVPFDTATNTWGTVETVDSGLSSSGVAQGCYQARLSDGTHWIFYSDTLSGTNQQIAYRKRTGANTYGTKVAGAFAATTVSHASPKAVVGAADVTYVAYSDGTNHHAYLRTLSATGTLSAATQIDDAGGYAPTPYLCPDIITRPVYYDDNGVEVITIGWANASGHLYLTQWRNGVKQTSQQINSTALVYNPAATTNDAVVAHLCVRQKRVYVVYAEAASGDLFLRWRDPDGTLSTATRIWDSPSTDASYYVFCETYTDPVDSGLYLGVCWDRGGHANDVSYVDFTRVAITDPATSSSWTYGWEVVFR